MKKHCNQCGLDWDSRIEKPRACPRCKRYDWNEPKKGERREVRHNESRAQVGREVRQGQQSPARTKRSQELPHRVEQTVGSGETVEPRPDTSVSRDEEAVISDEDIPEQEENLEPVKRCKNPDCAKPLQQVKGWWVCPDVEGCALGGKQQGKIE